MPTRSEKFRFAGKQIRKLPIFMAGKAIDGRVTSSADLGAILKTTRTLMKDRGLAPAVKLGHASLWSDRSQQPLRGYVEQVYRGKIDSPNGKGKLDAILADVVVDKVLADDYESGKYPGVSVELYPLYWQEAEDLSKCAHFIYGVALLGEDTAAYPELFNAQTAPTAPTAPKQYFSVVNIDPREVYAMNPKEISEKLGAITQNIESFLKEVDPETVDADALMALVDAIRATCDELQTMADEYRAEDGEDEDKDDAETVPPKEEAAAMQPSWREKWMSRMPKFRLTPDSEPKPEPKMQSNAQNEALAKRVKALESQLAAQKQSEVDRVFNSLVADGRVTIGERDIFEAIVSARGLDYARNHFAAQPAVRGPVQKRIKDLGDVMKEVGNEGFMAQLDKLGYTAEQKMAMFNSYADAEKRGMIVNHGELHRGVN